MAQTFGLYSLIKPLCLYGFRLVFLRDKVRLCSDHADSEYFCSIFDVNYGKPHCGESGSIQYAHVVFREGLLVSSCFKWSSSPVNVWHRKV